MAEMPDTQGLLHDEGLITLTTYHYTAPFPVWSLSKRDHEQHPEKPYELKNVLFPGQTTLPVSGLPLQFDPSGCPLELIKAEPFKDARGVGETRFTLRWGRNRMTPDASLGFFAARVYDQGNAQFAAAGRTCAIKGSTQDFDKKAAPQTVTFPKVDDAPANSRRIELKATSSSGLPVEYFVLKGPRHHPERGVRADGSSRRAAHPYRGNDWRVPPGAFQGPGWLPPCRHRLPDLPPPAMNRSRPGTLLVSVVRAVARRVIQRAFPVPRPGPDAAHRAGMDRPPQARSRPGRRRGREGADPGRRASRTGMVRGHLCSQADQYGQDSGAPRQHHPLRFTAARAGPPPRRSTAKASRSSRRPAAPSANPRFSAPSPTRLTTRFRNRMVCRPLTE